MLKLMAAGLAMAGLGGCDDGAPGGELIAPVRPAADAIAHGSNMFATASVVGGYASGVLVRHAAGRPVKVEGNPAHPASLGATDAIAQAEILGFYDPDRAAGIARGGVPQSWQNLQTALATQRVRWGETHGAGLRILTGSITSPSLARQFAALQQRYPAMRWHQWEPLPRDAVARGGDPRLRQAGRRCTASQQSRRDRRDRQRPAVLCAWPCAFRAGLSHRGEIRCARSDEPRLCDRADAHTHRCGGRPSPRRGSARTTPHRRRTGRYGAARRGASGRRAGLVARGGGRSAARRAAARSCMSGRTSPPSCTCWCMR